MSWSFARILNNFVGVWGLSSISELCVCVCVCLYFMYGCFRCNHTRTHEYKNTLSQNIDDKRLPQIDWMRDKCSYAQQKVVVPDTTFTWWLTPWKKNVTWFFTQILMVEFCSLIDTTSHTPPKIVITAATFPWT